MSDAIELVDDTHFPLHGRKADLISIVGKRSSLTYLNHQLNAVAGVVNGVSYIPNNIPATRHTHGSAAVAYLVALIVTPSLGATGVLYALHDRIDTAFIPHPLLLVDMLPRNEASKLARNMLATLIIQHSHRNTHKHGIRFTAPADHPTLPGYFPDHPIVPGAVLFDHALHTIGAALGRSFDACKISSAKFLSPTAPEGVFDPTFETTPSSAVCFIIRTGEREVINGILSAPVPEGVIA